MNTQEHVCVVCVHVAYACVHTQYMFMCARAHVCYGSRCAHVYTSHACVFSCIYTRTCACSHVHTRVQIHSTYHTHTRKTFGSLCKHRSPAEPQSPLRHSSKVHTQLCPPCIAPQTVCPHARAPACGSLAVPPPAPASTLTLLLHDHQLCWFGPSQHRAGSRRSTCSPRG